MSYIKKRVPRKPGATPQEIIADQRTLANWFTENVNLIVYTAGAVLLVLVIVLGVTWMKKSKNEAANSALSGAMALYQATVAKFDEEPATAAEKLEAALESLEEVAAAFPGLPQGQTASLFKANVLFRLGRYAEAAAILEELKAGSSELVDDLNAYYLLARSYEAMKDFTRAIESYEDARQGAMGDMSAVIDTDLARCHELNGDIGKAVSIYTEILSEYPDTVFANRAEKKLAIFGITDQETL